MHIEGINSQSTKPINRPSNISVTKGKEKVEIEEALISNGNINFENSYFEPSRSSESDWFKGYLTALSAANRTVDTMA